MGRVVGLLSNLYWLIPTASHTRRGVPRRGGNPGSSPLTPPIAPCSGIGRSHAEGRTRGEAETHAHRRVLAAAGPEAAEKFLAGRRV